MSAVNHHRKFLESRAKEFFISWTDITAGSEDIVIAQPPGSITLTGGLTNGSPGISVADENDLAGQAIAPNMELYEDELADLTGFATTYIIRTVAPDNDDSDATVANARLSVVGNWSGTGGGTDTIYIKPPGNTHKWVILGWELVTATAANYTLQSIPVGSVLSATTVKQVWLGANGAFSSFMPRELPDGEVLRIVQSAAATGNLTLWAYPTLV